MKSRCMPALALLLAACAGTPSAPPREVVFYPEPPDPPRIQFLRSISAGSDVEPPRSSALDNLLFGERLEEPKPIGKPTSIVFRDGVFYVADTEFGVILAIDLAKRTVDPVHLTGRARIVNPQSMVFGPDGLLYVADRGRRQIVVLDPEFRWVREFGPWSDDSGPTDVAVWQDRLYVADSGAACVRVLSLQDGAPLQLLGKRERIEEYLRGPSNLAVDDEGYVYVVDTVLSRIFTWDRDGAFVRQIAAPGDGAGHLARPKGLTCFGDTLWVLDSAFDNCQIFDLESNVQGYFGGPGPLPGAMSMPRKIWIGREGIELFADCVEPGFAPEALIAVSNSYGPRLSFYALGKSSGFTYPEVALPPRPIAVASTEPTEPAAAASATRRQP